MYQDSGHRPHARHTGETPENKIVEAPYHLTVTLDTWGPYWNLFPSLYDALQSNWGDRPSRQVNRKLYGGEDVNNDTGWTIMTKGEQEYIDKCFKGETLQQVLERITFSFLIDGCTRAATHQIVRTRLGAAFMQHGGRDNDWRHRPWVMPETIRRACVAMDDTVSANPSGMELLDAMEQKHCITDWEPIYKFLGVTHASSRSYVPVSLSTAISQYLQEGRELYAALVDAGIPWEDARRVLWMGTSTYIHADYNYLALRGMLANRLEHIMDWEINCIAQLMLREVKMKCPPVFSKYLGSASDRAGKAVFAGLQSWPPDGKYPNPFVKCRHCGAFTFEECSTFQMRTQTGDFSVDRVVLHGFDPIDALPREHRPEQNPFWVLHPDSMNGGPIQWIPTNGTYPHEAVR